MTKETLLQMGLTEEQTAKVLKGLAGSYVPKEELKELSTELSAAKATIKERDVQLDSLQASTGDVQTLQASIATLQADNKQKEESHAATIKALKLATAVDKALSEAHAKNSTAARALLGDFLEQAELAEDGTVKGLSDVIKKLSETEGTAFLFAQDASATSSISGASPSGGTVPPDPKRLGYETRLAEARKTGDTLSAIQVKQEAAAQGVVLL